MGNTKRIDISDMDKSNRKNDRIRDSMTKKVTVFKELYHHLQIPVRKAKKEL